MLAYDTNDPTQDPAKLHHSLTHKPRDANVSSVGLDETVRIRVYQETPSKANIRKISPPWTRIFLPNSPFWNVHEWFRGCFWQELFLWI